MPYHADLSLLSEHPCRLIAVGWLSNSAEYSRGPVGEVFFERLTELLINPWQPAISPGMHRCELCRFSGGPGSLCYQGRQVMMGSQDLYVPAEGVVYLAPSLVAHYIDAHGYAPPEEFCRAVMECPPMRSMEYLRALSRTGAARLARLDG